MMSKKCKYAIKALVKLAENKDKGNMFTQDISDTAHITKKFIEQILLELKRAGFVSSSRGYGGGYYLLMNPEDILIADVYRLFDRVIALVP